MNQTDRYQMVVRLPSAQKEEPVKEKIIIVKDCCDKSCKPILSSGCDLCYCPSLWELNPLCNYIGISGLLDGPDCNVCLQFEGQCKGECVGCQRVCEGLGLCPFNSGYLSQIPQTRY
jgi:hypothetical protein